MVYHERLITGVSVANPSLIATFSTDGDHCTVRGKKGSRNLKSEEGIESCGFPTDAIHIQIPTSDFRIPVHTHGRYSNHSKLS